MARGLVDAADRSQRRAAVLDPPAQPASGHRAHRFRVGQDHFRSSGGLTEAGVKRETVRAEAVPGWLRDHSGRIVTAGIVLALLYIGRSVLIPLALAIMLSLLVAPLVRALRRIGVGSTSSVFVAVGALTLSFIAIGAALGMQMLRIAESLPQYESNIQTKLRTLDELTVGRLRVVASEASHLIQIRGTADQIPTLA